MKRIAIAAMTAAALLAATPFASADDRHRSKDRSGHYSPSRSRSHRHRGSSSWGWLGITLDLTPLFFPPPRERVVYAPAPPVVYAPAPAPVAYTPPPAYVAPPVFAPRPTVAAPAPAPCCDGRVWVPAQTVWHERTVIDPACYEDREVPVYEDCPVPVYEERCEPVYEDRCVDVCFEGRVIGSRLERVQVGERRVQVQVGTRLERRQVGIRTERVLVRAARTRTERVQATIPAHWEFSSAAVQTPASAADAEDAPPPMVDAR